MLCNAKPIKIIVIIVAMLNKNVKEASLVVVSNPGIIPNKFALKIVACSPEIAALPSSHSLSLESSSSKISVPLVASAIATQSAIPSTSETPEKLINSSSIVAAGIKSVMKLSKTPEKSASLPN